MVFPAHFVLTCAHPRSTSQSVTHPQITPSQARLTLRFFADGLPENKEFLVDMSSLSILLTRMCDLHCVNLALSSHSSCCSDPHLLGVIRNSVCRGKNVEAVLYSCDMDAVQLRQEHNMAQW